MAVCSYSTARAFLAGFLLLIGTSTTPVASLEETVLGLHGSGTTNPSKCYWAVMEQFEARTKRTIHATYRAVGSTTGIAEFINNPNPPQPANDFGSGDLPLNKTVYDNFNASGVEIVHLPVLLGAVSVFHSVPLPKVNLTACLLARIFSRDIKEWEHPDIVKLNPELATFKLPITVARRVKGSSSTDSVTKYLWDACPDHWSEAQTGSLPTWPTDTKGCEGSGGVTACIKEKEGTIGYIDAGHGINAGLNEIELENKDGTLQSSQESSEKNGIAAAEAGVLPSAADQDFSAVSLLNRPGQFTWPIVQMTYLYVRKDLSYFDSPEEKTLFIAFLKALFNENYVQQCVDNYGFTLPSASARQFALDGIAMLDAGANVTDWIFEDSTMPVTGMGDFVISSKRKRISDVERASLESSIASLEAENTQLKQSINNNGGSSSGMTDSQETQLKAALAMASISFAVIILAIFALLGKFVFKCF